MTPAADAFLQQLVEQAGSPLTFRIRVNPESRAGRRIEVDLVEDPEESPAAGELTLEASGYRLLMDGQALAFLDDYHMDFDDSSGPEAAFTFHHSHTGPPHGEA